MNTLTRINSSNGSMPVTTFGRVAERLFQNNVGRFFDDGQTWQRAYSVPVNIRETGNTFELDVIAPGHAKQDFKITIDGATLTVYLEHEEQNSEQDKAAGWLRKEYSKQSFSRSFTVSESIDTRNISAEYRDGILRVSMPKKESFQSVSRSIEIQ